MSCAASPAESLAFDMPAEPAADRALVIADDFGIFLAVARSLGRRGIEVHALASDPEAPGLRSRYVAAVHGLPAYRASPEAWATGLRALIDAHRIRLVLPCGDSALHLLRFHAGTLGRDRLALPGDRAFDVFTDKAETRALAASLGVPVAAGEPVAPGTDPAALAARLGLPLVLKPRLSYRLGDEALKRSARIVRDPAGLESALAEADEGWLAESFFAGEGVGVSLVAQDGRVLAAWQHRRLRAVSETGGSTIRAAEAVDPALLGEAAKLAAATALTGVAMFEFRRDPATGAHVLLEVNPRFWGSLPLALAAGADFPSLLWDVLTGAEPSALPPPDLGMSRRSMTGELDRLAGEGASGGAAHLRLAAGLVGFIAGLPLRARFDSWAADDPAPYVAERRQCLARLARRALGRAR